MASEAITRNDLTSILNEVLPPNDVIITGSVTPSSGATSALNVRQIGKLVVINGYINNVNLTANSESNLGYLTGVSLPTEAVRSLAGVASGAYTHPADVAYLCIATDGRIYVVSTQSSRKALWFSVSYIVNA